MCKVWAFIPECRSCLRVLPQASVVTTLLARRSEGVGGCRLRTRLYGSDWYCTGCGCDTHMLAAVRRRPISFGVLKRVIEDKWGLSCCNSRFGSNLWIVRSSGDLMDTLHGEYCRQNFAGRLYTVISEKILRYAIQYKATVRKQNLLPALTSFWT